MLGSQGINSHICLCSRGANVPVSEAITRRPSHTQTHPDKGQLRVMEKDQLLGEGMEGSLP